jgi:hypothetical protein
MEVKVTAWRLKNFAAVISKIHPGIYGLIYLGLIPVFASAYYAYSSEFYSPYARYEPDALSDRESVGVLIENAIRRSLSYRKPNSTILVQGWRFKLASINVSQVGTVDGSTIDFKARLLLEKETTRGVTASLVELPVSFPGDRGRIVRQPGYNRSYANNVRPTRITISRGPAERMALEEAVYGEIFKSYGEDIVMDEAIVLSELESKNIDKFLSGIRGNAAAISGTCLRMLYFSAVVITTVGFGDIVPMTARMRGLVAAEAIFGIILAGLFLNAVAHRASTASSKGSAG